MNTFIKNMFYTLNISDPLTTINDIYNRGFVKTLILELHLSYTRLFLWCAHRCW